MFVDSHAHIDGKQFASDREAMLERARAAGVQTLITIGNGDGPDEMTCGITYAEKYDWIYTTLGVHPHEARLMEPRHLASMEESAKHPKVLAIGEIGLDYFYDHSPRELQQQVFVAQMEVAKKVKKPIILHIRPSEGSENAWKDCFHLLEEHWAASGLGTVFHCFTGEVKHAERALELGSMISFAGNVTFPKAQNIRDAAKIVPPDRFFIETDCPYLAPVPHRGKRNEPAFVVETARQIGELRGWSREETGRIAAENFYRFFGIKR
jgi:TatD DNase family protein